MALGDLVASLAADPGASGLDAIKQRQLLAQQLMEQGGSTAPIRSPWQGVANLVKGLQGGFEGYMADKQQKDWTQSGNDVFSKALAPQVSVATPANAGTATASAETPDPTATEAYIRQRAASYGIDPDTAVKVAGSEGLRAYTGDSSSSFGPFQLHYGGVAQGGNSVAGLGDDFTKATGLDARDPKTLNAQIDFALAHASQNGWGAFHGAGNSGIGEWDGIGKQPSVQVASNSSAVPTASAGPISVPGYEGKFTRDQANDSEGVPSQAEWDAAAKAAGTGAVGASSPPQVAAAAPVAPKPAVDPQGARLLAAMADPHITPAQRQVLGLLYANTQKSDTLVNAGSGYLYNQKTGQWIASPGAGKDDATAKASVIGEDQYGRKIYGTVDKSGNPHPFQLPQSPAPAAAGGQAPPNSPDLINVHGEDYLKTLDQNTQGQVRAIIEGRAPYPTGMLLKTPYGQQLAAHVTQADPTFESGNASARTKLRQTFTSGGPNLPAGTINAGNTAIQHLGHLSDAAESLGNTNVPMYNTVKNAIATGTGGGLPVVDFNNVLGKYSEEATKFYRGVGGSEADIKREIESLNPNQSHDQLRTAIKAQAELMQSKINALQEQWRNGMGPLVPDAPIVSQKSQDVLDRVRQRASGTGYNPSHTASPAASPKRYKYDTSGNLVPQ